MKKLQFTKTIKAPASLVYDTMLGIHRKKDYEEWTAAFNPTSTFKGTWEEGSKIYFTGTDEEGTVGGMVSKIEKNIPNEFISIKHIGILKGEKEITEGPEVAPWAGMLENYTFQEEEGITTVIIETDSDEEYENYFNETWEKALQQLKILVEKKNRPE